MNSYCFDAGKKRQQKPESIFLSQKPNYLVFIIDSEIQHISLCERV